jgi:amino acid adenylation domain-containing protein
VTVSTSLDHSPGLILADAGFDQDVRWSPGERLEDLFAQRCAQTPDQLAVDAPGTTVTFAELDGRANQLARHLIEVGIPHGGRVALLFDDAAQAYIAMLAVLKAGAAYVPLDPGFPADRMAYIAADAEVSVVLSLSHLRGLLAGVGVPVVCVDAAGFEDRDTRPVSPSEVDPLAYIIYTSGSTGRPKGVAVEHAAICNFVRVAAEVYGIRPDDRMYQGLTIAFDFSVEEIWVPWIAGATLVPKPSGAALLGVDLYEYLVEHRVTAMCCVPTLLATLGDDVPGLRFLLVSGEACPHDLIVRWHRPGRRFLNVYGPTEATVTATWTAVDPDRAVTIGVPLPTYSTVILDPEAPNSALPPGEIGEIGIAGIGLAAGYVNRPDLTGRAFVPDFLGIPGNPSGRIYRTGDLGRVSEDGEIEYHGRIDLQVKIRGYRIELTEIESVLLQVPGVAQAVVDTYEPVPGTVELVGYYSLRTDGTGLDAEAIRTVLRERLPGYMVPAYLEHLDVVPMTTQGKADRRNLPVPTARLAATAVAEHVAPDGPSETALAELLAQTLGLEQVSVTAHFFDDLGANSLLLAQYCTRIRQHADLPGVSTKQLYLNPTVRQLAAATELVSEKRRYSDVFHSRPAVVAAPTEPRASTARYLMCGALQILLSAATGIVGLLTIRALTNTGFTRLLGDSVFVTGFLRALGYRLRPLEQTGSNFGLIMKHATPYLSSVGTGTMISDGLTIANVDYTSTSFRVGRVSVGRRNFLGNHITVPATSRVGDNCLIATRAMVPIDGQVRRDVGLLGSPAFEIPRSVQRDARFDRFRHPDQLRWRLRAKTRHNTVSILLHLLVLGFLLVAAVIAALAAVDLYSLIGVWSLPAAGLALFVLTFATLVVVERAATRFRPLQPKFCSIYQTSFWRHERFWKLTTTSFFDFFNGTPFKGLVWRLLGVRIGRRVFDDGCSIPEKSLVTIGDDCVLGAGSSLWCHTLEDGTFKSDRITVGNRCTLGVGAFALYGVTLGERSLLDTDAFLLKGEEVPAGARWAGNPAAEVRR